MAKHNMNVFVNKLRSYLPDNQVNIVLKMEIELLLQQLDPLKLKSKYQLAN